MAGNLDVTAHDLDLAGAGVGIAAGPGGPRTVHVADLLPGERARVAIEHASPHQATAWARVVERLGPPSPDRVAPACPAWGQCGGCAWQHLAYPAQLAAKRERVARALAGLPVAIEPVRPAPATTGYRNKGKYVVGGRAGAVVLGAWAPRSHTLVDTAGCRVVSPAIERARAAIAAAADAAGVVPHDERRRTGHLRYAIVREAQGGALLVVLVVRSDAPEAVLSAMARALAAADPAIAGVLRVDNDRTDGGLLDGTARVLAGADHVVDRVAAVEVALGAVEFAQVNPAAADGLYALAAEVAAVGPGELAADVYAGVGGFGFALARAGATVFAIEREPAAVTALAAAARAAGLGDRVRATAGDAATLAELPGPLAAIVIDPPRKGCSPEVLAALVAAPARRLVYVSCGPDSLGRDLRTLVDGGWSVTRVQPVDLMPGTAQVEVVAVLDRKQAHAAAPA